MRISTQQIYQQSLAQMLDKQRQLQHTELQLSSGLRIMKPSDDPAGATRVENLSRNIEVLEQYRVNADKARSALGFEENVLTGIGNDLQRIRELTVQANNASNTAAARKNIALEITALTDAILVQANTRNEDGEYIFAGHRSASPPFIKGPGGVSYQGDQGERQLLVAEGARVTVRDAGQSVFREMAGGNGVLEAATAAGNRGSLLLGEVGHHASWVPGQYLITFSPVGSDEADYVVTDSGGATLVSGTYQRGQSLEIIGARLVLDGMPAEGDQIMVQTSQAHDLFAILGEISAILDVPAVDESSRTRLHNILARGLENLDQSLESINTTRASIGARLNNIDSLDEINQDLGLQLESVRSDTRDLDYAEAISRFNLQLNSLQAAQSAFARMSSLSLFEYL